MKKFFILIACSLLSYGCLFSPQKDISRFYVLGLAEVNGRHSDCTPITDGRKLVCIDLEEIPSYSDVSSIVKLHNGCEVIKSEYFRWGEPLKDGINRSLCVHISQQLPDNYSVLSSPYPICLNDSEYKVKIRITNFVFNDDKNETCLSATIFIFYKENLYAICEYNDHFNVGSKENVVIIKGMDWAIKMLGDFICRCIDCQSKRNKCIYSVSDTRDETHSSIGVRENKLEQNTQSIDQTNNFPKVISIFARGEVYVVVDSQDGQKRYFSGRLFDGASIDVKCDTPFKVTSTNDDLIDVK